MDEYQIRSYILNLLNTTEKSIKLKLKTNYNYLRQRKLYFEIKEYVDNFLNKCNQEKFFVIPGLRGVGKTTILYQLYDYLINEQKIDSNRVLFLDLEFIKDEPNLKIIDFFNVFIKQINDDYYLTDKPLFIFVDEVQYDPNWASAGKVIFDEHVNVFLIFTGSNALNLGYTADVARRFTKKELYPLNFEEYLEIKYNINLPHSLPDLIYNLILSGEINETEKLERKIQIQIYKNLTKDLNLLWEDYIQYGTLPFGIEKTKINTITKTLDIKDKIIEKDFSMIKTFNQKSRFACYYLLKQLAMQKPKTVSYHSLADLLNIDEKTVKSLLETLSKTQIIFPIESYGLSSKRIRNSKEFYFLATQVKAAYFLSSGDVSNDFKQYLGILLENLVATSLFKMKERRKDGFGIYYDSKNGGVDFIIKTFNDKAIPIEVGIGKKNKKQITKAIKQYKADYGIVISNKTDHIIKEDNVIFIPVMTFSLI